MIVCMVVSGLLVMLAIAVTAGIYGLSLSSGYRKGLVNLVTVTDRTGPFRDGVAPCSPQSRARVRLGSPAPVLSSAMGTILAHLRYTSYVIQRIEKKEPHHADHRDGRL